MTAKLGPLVAFAFMAAPAGADLSSVRLAVTGDWNGDGVADAAMLAVPERDEGFLTLWLFFGDPADGRLTVAEAWADRLWGTYAMAGQAPELTALPNGSLAVVTQNASIGRNRWRQQLTLAYRDGAFRVAGFTYEAVDTLEADGSGPTTCDLNLFAGRGVVNGAETRFQPHRPTLAGWDETETFELCGLI